VARPHILAIVFASTLTYGWIFAEQHSLLIPLLAVWDWFIVNFTNKATDIEEDIANGITGAEAVAKHKRAMEAAMVAMIAGGLIAGWFVAPMLTPFRVVFTLIGLAYNYKLIPWWVSSPSGRRFGFTRFKEMYFWKNFGSSMLFTLSVFLYPYFGLGMDTAIAGDFVHPATSVLGADVLFAHQPAYPFWAVLISIGFFIPLELTYEILYDLRDVEGDTAEGVPTYPVAHGTATAKMIIYGLLAFSAVFPIAGALAGVLRLREWVVVAGILQQLILVRIYAGGDRLPNQRECILITWIGAAQLMSYNIWVWIGLPLGA